MKITIENLQDTFQIGYDAYLDSRLEAAKVYDYYHNRQWTDQQEAILESRGQPKETFNIVKLFTRQLIGYYSTVINSIKISPRQQSDVVIASLLNDVVSYTIIDNKFEAVGDYIKMDGLLTGLFSAYIDVVETGETDEFGRKLRKIKIESVPNEELVLDPMSTRIDYSDARYIHRFKWVSEETVKKLFKSKFDELDAYYNHLNIDESDFEYKFETQFQGKYKLHNNYLIVHSIMEDDNGDTWSVYWHDDIILEKKNVTYKDVKFPYRVVKLQDSNKAEYYGIFREVMESQNAINQALSQIQLLVNTNKVFVEDGAVENIEEFKRSFTRVNSVVIVDNLQGIKIENMSGEIQQQYIIIDKAFDRIQRLLGINDSFLGMAFASDSGRKVKLQQNATIMALRYIDNKLGAFYEMIGWDIVNLIKQYYTASQTLRIVDESVGERWVQINQPLMVPDQNMEPSVVWDEELNPETGEPEKDEYGNIILTPLNNADTDISFAEVDLVIDSVNYNDEDEKNQLLLETVLNGNLGKNLATVNPAGYFKISSLSVKSAKTKYSKEIADVLDQTAMMLSPQPEQQQNLGGAADVSSQQSPTLQLPKEG